METMCVVLLLFILLIIVVSVELIVVPPWLVYWFATKPQRVSEKQRRASEKKGKHVRG
jgi:hypothetical protein